MAGRGIANFSRARRHLVGAAALLAVAAGLVLASAAAVAQPARPRVLVTTVDGPITPVVADHLADGVRRATREGHAAYLVRLDTPGGLDTSMRRIVRTFLAARVPVVVHVSPRGARAASAGAIIAFAANVVAMAPGTTIGAATPVRLEGGEVERKVVNDAAAFAESIARLRGRNVDFARDTVREGRAAPAEEAVDLGAADLIAPSLASVLARVDGRATQVGGDRRVTLRTADALVERHRFGLLRGIQQRLADPNVAFLLLSLGTLGLVYELASPGVGGAGVVGALATLLGLFALSVLPVDVVGLLFLALAAALFVAELFAPGVGVAAVGGAVSLALAAVFLFREAPGVDVSIAVLAPVVLLSAGAVVLAGRLALRTRKEPSRITGEGLYVGREVHVRRASGPAGQAFVEGAWWRLRGRGRDLREGERVRVVAVHGLDLVVEPVTEDPEHSEEVPN